MRERIQAEIDLLREKYPSLVHGENLQWVLIPDFLLPKDRYTKERCKVLFTLSTGYPNTAPDNFFVDRDLSFKTMAAAIPAFNPNNQSSSGPAPIEGEWAWFSWHPQSWHPAAETSKGDNLMTFMLGVGMCLRGEEAL